MVNQANWRPDYYILNYFFTGKNIEHKSIK